MTQDSAYSVGLLLERNQCVMDPLVLVDCCSVQRQKLFNSFTSAAPCLTRVLAMQCRYTILAVRIGHIVSAHVLRGLGNSLTYGVFKKYWQKSSAPLEDR